MSEVSIEAIGPIGSGSAANPVAAANAVTGAQSFAGLAMVVPPLAIAVNQTQPVHPEVSPVPAVDAPLRTGSSIDTYA